MRDRRKKPRSQYSATALVYQGNQQFTARIINISASGVLLHPPVKAGRGTFLRLHMSLPALDQVLDLDGVVMREATYKGHYAWGVHFHEPPADATAVLEAYVAWRKERAAARKPEEPARPATDTTSDLPQPKAAARQPSDQMPTTGTHPAIRQKTTGPHQQAVPEAKQKKAFAKSRKRAEDRWRKRSKATQADRELRDLYRAALRDVVGRPKSKSSTSKEKKKNWIW